MSDAVSKPQAGQWYQYHDDEERVWCLGYTFNGDPVFQYNCGSLFDAPEEDWQHFKHLPDCTGWDWVQETFPQYWTTLDKPHHPSAFIRRDGPSRYTIVYKDGSESQGGDWYLEDAKERTRLTESEALALLDKPTPQPPAESPGDWVEITDPEHVLLDDDELNARRNSSSKNIGSTSGYGGWCTAKRLGTTGNKLSLYIDDCRCRRRDLPKPAPEKRRVSVPMWLVTYKRDGSTYMHFQSVKPNISSDYTVEPAGMFEVEV